VEEARSSERGHKPKPIKVKVTFPLAGKEHYESKDAPETRVEQVRIAAMNHFGLAPPDLLDSLADEARVGAEGKVIERRHRGRCRTEKGRRDAPHGTPAGPSVG